jgi:nickel-type superoxide dismutase maturation protease
VGRYGFMVAKVSGSSMLPQLKPGDLILLLKTQKLKVGQIAIAKRPDRPNLLVIKRVKAVTKNGYWLEGDNLTESDDSRIFGEVDKDLILGKFIFRYWPLFTN